MNLRIIQLDHVQLLEILKINLIFQILKNNFCTNSKFSKFNN